MMRTRHEKDDVQNTTCSHRSDVLCAYELFTCPRRVRVTAQCAARHAPTRAVRHAPTRAARHAPTRAARPCSDTRNAPRSDTRWSV